MTYETIAAIYNPNSTGPSESMARDFVNALKKKLPEQKIELIATKKPGHAEEIAYSLAKSSKNCLVVSSSGDGGYHEMINGALKAQTEGYKVTTGLLPAGNANDHYRSLHEKDIIYQIINGNYKKIDILKISGVSRGRPIERYAHSYVGVGLTPKVGRELNKTKLNLLNEIFIALRVLFLAKSTKLKVKGDIKHYDSIVFSNISKMSKYLHITKPSSVTDGKFEITAFRRRHKLRLIGVLIKASLIGLRWEVQASEFSLETVRKTLFQADGEVLTVDAGTKVVISAEKQILTCVI